MEPILARWTEFTDELVVSIMISSPSTSFVHLCQTLIFSPSHHHYYAIRHRLKSGSQLMQMQPANSSSLIHSQPNVMKRYISRIQGSCQCYISELVKEREGSRQLNWAGLVELHCFLGRRAECWLHWDEDYLDGVPKEIVQLVRLSCGPCMFLPKVNYIRLTDTTELNRGATNSFATGGRVLLLLLYSPFVRTF